MCLDSGAETEAVVNESQSTPDPFEQAYGEGSRLFQQQRFNEAIDAFARAAPHRPDDFRPWEMTACCHGSRGEWPECVAAFERARALGHECHMCCFNRGFALARLRRANDALQALERSLELEPNNAAAWYERGMILGMAHGRAQGEMEPFDGRHEQAVVAFDRVIALQPDHYGAWYCKAYTLYKMSHSWSAIQGLTALGYAPDVAQQALTCIEHALTLRPNDPQAEGLRETIREWIAETA
jgi:tetratricopeptide (TPR) repeat protein